MSEVWRAVAGYEGFYEVSDLGRVKSLERFITNNGRTNHKKERLLSTTRPKAKSYCSVALCKDGEITVVPVHRLVATAFIPNPDNKPVVDHIDTDPSNNRVDNLRWVTVRENTMNPLTRKHNSESKKGHPGYLACHTEETKQKLREAKRGKALSDTHRANLSAGLKRYFEDPNNRKAAGGFTRGKHWKVEGDKRVWY